MWMSERDANAVETSVWIGSRCALVEVRATGAGDHKV